MPPNLPFILIRFLAAYIFFLGVANGAWLISLSFQTFSVGDSAQTGWMAIHTAALMAIACLVWALSRPLARMLGIFPNNIGFDAKPEALVRLGAFLIGLYFFAGSILSAVTNTFYYYYLHNTSNSDTADWAASLHFAVNDWATAFAGIVIIFSGKWIRQIYHSLNKGGTA